MNKPYRHYRITLLPSQLKEKVLMWPLTLSEVRINSLYVGEREKMAITPYGYMFECKEIHKERYSESITSLRICYSPWIHQVRVCNVCKNWWFTFTWNRGRFLIICFPPLSPPLYTHSHAHTHTHTNTNTHTCCCFVFVFCLSLQCVNNVWIKSWRSWHIM